MVSMLNARLSSMLTPRHAIFAAMSSMDNIASIGSRIREAREIRGISQTVLARRCGVSRAAVSQWESDATTPTGPNLVSIASTLMVSPRWLAEGKGPRDSKIDPMTPNIEETDLAVGPTRVIGEVEAGVFKDTLEYVADDQFDIYVPVDPRYRGLHRAALKVRGPSMNLIYPEGSFIVVVPVLELGEDWAPRSGMRVVVQRSNSQGQMEATVKEIEIDSDGHFWLAPKSSHPGFTTAWRVPDKWDGNGDFDEHSDNLRITGLVIGSYRPEG